MTIRERAREKRRERLNEVRVASPCHVDWERMAGDEKVRFCGSCELHVYNLSAMDVEEAAEVIQQNEGRLCVRFYRRADGTVLTQDCPVGADRVRRKRRQVVGATVLGTAAAAMLSSAVFIPLGVTQGRPSMGAIAIPPPVPAPSPVITEPEGTPPSHGKWVQGEAPAAVEMGDVAAPRMGRVARTRPTQW